MIFPDIVYMLVFLYGAFQYIFTKLLPQISRLIGEFHHSSRDTFAAWWSTENRVTALTKVFFTGIDLVCGCTYIQFYEISSLPQHTKRHHV